MSFVKNVMNFYRQHKMRKTADIAIAAFFAVLAVCAVIIAIVFSAWWHYMMGAMCAILACAIYKAE